MKIGLGLNENYKEVDSLVKALQEFKEIGTEITDIQCVNSIEETEEDGERLAVFDIAPVYGVLYILVHNGSIINFMKKEG